MIFKTLKKYSGLILLTGMLGAAGAAAFHGHQNQNTDGSTNHPAAAGLTNVHADSDTCRVAGNVISLRRGHTGTIYDFSARTVIRQTQFGAVSTSFAQVKDSRAQARAHEAYALLPAGACPQPVFPAT